MRCCSALKTWFQLGALSVALTALAQEPQPEQLAEDAPDGDIPGARSNETARQREILEQCANVPGAIDLSVLDDRHVYIRTRGSNHYLLTTEQCDRMYTAYLRAEVLFVPYGRRVCRNDGSYLRYVDGGRPRNCNIEHIQRVENRAAARELAAVPSPAVEFEPVELSSDTEPDSTPQSGQQGEPD